MSDARKPAGSLGFRFVKRTLDLVSASVLLIPIGLVIGACAIAIKLEDRGPVFYIAERTGRFNKTFRMLKLRSMKVDAPDIRLADGSTFNSEDDPRVTRFGRFARKTSIDELPQVINILKGDMSFVGPRPDTPVGSAAYTEEEKQILTVRPGITGYNQAVNRNSVLTKDKLKADLYYVQHLSLGLDAKIIFMTVATVLKHTDVNRTEPSLQDTYILEKDGTKSSTNLQEADESKVEA